jgi:hypothetical protein
MDNTSSPLARGILSAGASAVAETFTFPVDLAKTRLQTEKKPQGMMRTLVTLARTDGFLAICECLS